MRSPRTRDRRPTRRRARPRAAALALLLLASGLAAGCAATVGADATHLEYGYCQRSVRHRHNDHVFLGDYHDHSLCEWLRYE